MTKAAPATLSVAQRAVTLRRQRLAWPDINRLIGHANACVLIKRLLPEEWKKLLRETGGRHYRPRG